MSEPTKPGDPQSPATRKKKLSVFALARPATGVRAEIDVDDVLQLRPSWTPEQAAAFLAANAEAIGSAMVICGAEALVSILGGDPHAN